MQYVNVLLWVLIIVLITAVLCAGISILWVETQREKWFDEGRVFEREEKELKFKRTKGTRRMKDRVSKLTGNSISTVDALRGSRAVLNPPKPMVTKSKRERTK